MLVVNRDSAGPYEHVLLAADLSRMSAGIAHVTKELGLLEAARASVVHALQHTRGAMLYLAGVSESEVDKYQQSCASWLRAKSTALLASAGLNSARFVGFSAGDLAVQSDRAGRGPHWIRSGSGRNQSIPSVQARVRRQCFE